jgi:DNA-binding CsgD family transcriptional regulator
LQPGNAAQAYRVAREVVAEQEQLAREDGAEHAFACWPLLMWSAAARAEGALDDALLHYQSALRHARTVQELRGTAEALAGVAGLLGTGDQTRLAAWLFGATEAFCNRSGISFFDETWGLQRDLGLPPSWQEVDTSGPTGPDRELSAPPPVPDPDAEFWIAGRTVPIDDAVAAALAVDLKIRTAAIIPRRYSAVTRDADHRLTPREHAVLVLLCERLTDPQIAERLYLSPRTVESHVSSILGKLNVGNRRDAAAAAVRLALV